MMEVVRLEHKQYAPENVVLVDQDRSRGITGLGDMMLGPGAGVTFYVTAPYREAEEADAIEKAKAHASAHGIARVYVARRAD
jgi:hypothetical protein